MGEELLGKDGEDVVEFLDSVGVGHGDVLE